MDVDPTEDPLPFDDGLDRRRIRATVLDYQATTRRRRLPVIATVASAVCGADFVVMAGQLAKPHPFVAFGVAAGALVCLCCAGLMWKRLSRIAPQPPTTPSAANDPDFTGLGDGPSLAEKLMRVGDEAE